MNKMNKGLKNISLATVVYLFLGIIMVMTVFPVLYAVLGSFKSNAEVTLGGTILPKDWIFSNYGIALSRFNFFQYTFNTVYLGIFTTIGSLILSSAAGYCLARRDFPGKKLITAVFLSTMFISVGAVTLRPLYMLAVGTKMHNSLWSIILIQVGTTQATNIFLVSKFVEGIPKELDESATIDGCSFVRIYWQIILPLIKPILGVVGLFSFRYAWNDYILPAVFTMTRPDLRPLTVGVVSLRYGDSAAAEWNIMLTGASLAIIPMLVIYIFANRTFISGLTAGAVKG